MKYKNMLTVIMMLFGTISSLQSFAQNNPVTGNTGMLVLGSDNINTLRERVDVAHKLYESSISFDYIIVSGGCAAHKSNICEATEMADLLVEKGVPASKVFKEEKSKSTVQNYCYSRMLRKDDGTSIINPGDRLYVVSNHWHAIPVAARFTVHDKVHATYHVEGSILPKDTDKVNYTNIYSLDINSDNYCRAALWPMVRASYSAMTGNQEDEIAYHFLNDIIYPVDVTGGALIKAKMISKSLSDLPLDWTTGIDAAFLNDAEDKLYLIKGEMYLRFSAADRTIDPGYPRPFNDLVKNLPEEWQGKSIDAAFYYRKDQTVYLFMGDEYLQLSAKNGKIKKGFPQKIPSMVANWPFGWGSGDVDAAYYSDVEGKLYIFRGKEYVKVALDGDAKVESGYPQKATLKWPQIIFGEK